MGGRAARADRRGHRHWRIAGTRGVGPHLAVPGPVDAVYERLAYEAAERALDKQERLIEELRSRMGVLLAVASLAASLRRLPCRGCGERLRARPQAPEVRVRDGRPRA